ncbi:MAG: ParB/RepB/Spo0J family partition protein [Pseudomonadota bacterium]
MAKRRRGLGNIGVDVLLSAASAPIASVTDMSNKDSFKPLPVDVISRSKYQPRLNIQPEALQELADSIRAQGLVQPIIVRPVNEGYELIAGERRWRAAQLAGLQEIPAIVKSIPDQAAAAMTLIENIQREDLNPLEEAGAFKRLIDEFELTHQQVADAVGRSRAAVSNMMRLLDLGVQTKQYLEQGMLEMGHARALLGLNGDTQAEAARFVTAHGLSVRETERYIKTLLSNKPQSLKENTAKDPDVASLEQRLSQTLGTSVDIRYNTKGKGKLIIKYSSLDELDGILAHIK